MSNNTFQSDPRMVDVVLTGTVSSGDVIISGKIIGIATIDGVSGETIAVDTKGSYTLTADAGNAFVLGDLLYWDVSAAKLVKSAGDDNTFLGTCVLAKASSTATGEVKLREDAKPGDGAVAEIVFHGEFTTAGGDATESIALTGLLATDIVQVTVHTVGATPRVILTSLAVADAITVVFADDPSTDHVLSYIATRSV